MSERIDVIRVFDDYAEGIEFVFKQARGRNRPRTQAVLQEVRQARDLVSDAFEFIRDADCNCRPATEKYEAHTCRRCELLAKIGGAE